MNTEVSQHNKHITGFRLRKPTLEDKIHATLTASYLAIAGIYWFPGIPYTLIAQIKITIYAILVIVGVIRFRIFSAKQQKVYFWLAACALNAFLASAITTNLNTAFSQSRNYIEPLLWLVALSGIRPQVYSLFFSKLKFTLSIFFLLSLYPVGVYLGLLPNFYAPESFADPTGLNPTNISLLQSTSTIGGGFNGSRTGWGVTVSTTALMLSALYLMPIRRNSRTTLIVLLIVLSSIMSIAVTSARGGTLALTAVAIYGIIITRGYGQYRLLLLAVFILASLYSDLLAFLPDNFLRYFGTSGGLFDRLNAISTGRLESYMGALQHFVDSPIIGKGPIEATVVVRMVQELVVHNLWLRQLAESGLIVLVPLIALTRHIALLALETPNKRSKLSAKFNWPPSQLVIVCGLIMALIEPSVIIGSFNTNAIFWTATWIALTSKRARTQLRQYTKHGFYDQNF